MNSTPYTLLVVDDSKWALQPLARALGPEDFALRVAPLGPEVPKLAREAALVVLCPGPEPAPTLALLRQLVTEPDEPGTPVVVLAPAVDRATRLEALGLGIEVISDPWDDAELRARVLKSLREHARRVALASRLGELQRLSVTDGLTGVHNHRHFQHRLREEFRRAQRYDDALSLILLDLDHFKRVNDTHGHTVGDAVLREVAAALTRSIRETDLVARYGGEEFALLLPRTHLTGALTVAERVQRELRALRPAEEALRVTASLGVSSLPHRSVLSPEQLLLTADQALLRAKEEGRDRICLYPQLPLFSPPSSQGG
ncbi:MAG TPA: diguanylate cyclase [Myxococcus sp.]|nr:diguanylate cyclase [Myxococcus sp.]